MESDTESVLAHMTEDKRVIIPSLKLQTNFSENADAIELYRIEHLRSPKEKAVHLAKYPHLSEMGQTLTERNPKFEKMLSQQIARIERNRKMKNNELFMKQRNFFIKSVFDAENGLRFLKAKEGRSRRSTAKQIKRTVSKLTQEPEKPVEPRRIGTVYFRSAVKGKARLDSTNIRSIEEAHQQLRLHRASLSSIIYNKQVLPNGATNYDQALRRRPTRPSIILPPLNEKPRVIEKPISERTTPTSSLENHKPGHVSATLSVPQSAGHYSQATYSADKLLINSILKSRSEANQTAFGVRRIKHKGSNGTKKQIPVSWRVADSARTNKDDQDIMWITRTKDDEQKSMEKLLQRMTISLPSNLISAAGGHRSTINHLNNALGYTTRNERLLQLEAERLSQLETNIENKFDAILSHLERNKLDVNGNIVRTDGAIFNKVIQPMRDAYRSGYKFRSKGGDFIVKPGVTLADVQAIRDRRELIAARGLSRSLNQD